MPAQLNHMIVWSSDPAVSATFLTWLLDLPPPKRFGHFQVVDLSNGAALDFANADLPIQSQHYAFLVTEDEFDGALARIHQQGLKYWADPFLKHAGRINHHDGGRGLYFLDPDGHNLELITRPYSASGAS